MRVRDSSVCHSLTQNERVSPSMTKIESLCTMGAGSTQPPSSNASSSGRYWRNSSLDGRVLFVNLGGRQFDRLRRFEQQSRRRPSRFFTPFVNGHNSVLLMLQ